MYKSRTPTIISIILEHLILICSVVFCICYIFMYCSQLMYVHASDFVDLICIGKTVF